MSQTIEAISSLVKALEAGSYNVAPSQLVQGAALMTEDLSNVMQVVTADEKAAKMQKDLKTETCKSTLAQFDRQLSYGVMGGSAQLEGHVGQEETSQYTRITVPMCYYSHTRRVTLVATMVNAVDGKKADEKAAADAAKKILFDVEFDIFRGKADFSNSGVFDGNPMVIPALPNILSLDCQIRMSDSERQAQDQMFAEFGSDESCIIAGGSTLQQENIEDAWTRSQMNHGEADVLFVDPKVLSNYNKITYAKERIVLAGSPQEATGATLRKQWTSGGVVEVEASRFLSGKTSPAPSRPAGPSQPTLTSVTPGAISGVTTGFLAGQVYTYNVTACNEVGESVRSSNTTGTIATTGHGVTLVIADQSSVRFFNVYRSAAGSSVCKFIGRVIKGSTTTTFIDIGNKQPAFVSGLLVQKDTMALKELAPYSRLKLAVTELSQPEAHFRFLTLCVYQPRKNVLIDNLR